MAIALDGIRTCISGIRAHSASDCTTTAGTPSVSRNKHFRHSSVSVCACVRACVCVCACVCVYVCVCVCVIMIVIVHVITGMCAIFANFGFCL